jgi:hypothetical protein
MLILLVWSGHSCPLPLTLILLLTLLLDPTESPPPPAPRMKERTLQRRAKHPKQTLVIPNRAEGPVRNLLLPLLILEYFY